MHSPHARVVFLFLQFTGIDKLTKEPLVFLLYCEEFLA